MNISTLVSENISAWNFQQTQLYRTVINKSPGRLADLTLQIHVNPEPLYEIINNKTKRWNVEFKL